MIFLLSSDTLLLKILLQPISEFTDAIDLIIFGILLENGIANISKYLRNPKIFHHLDKLTAY